MNPDLGDPGASLFSGGILSRADALDRLLRQASGRFPSLQWLTSDRFSLTGQSLTLAFFALLLLLFLPKLVRILLRKSGLTAPNFRGDSIPVGYGLFIALHALATILLARSLFPPLKQTLEHGAAMIFGFAFLGWLDDRFGGKAHKGLRGHLKALVVEKRVTTGLIKLIGGIALSFWLSIDLPGSLFMNALLIALCANFFNLLDLRPGRASSVFLIAGVLLIGLGFATPILLLVFVPACAAWLPDSLGKAMLGDTGSNLLGASLGYALAQSSLSLIWKLILIGLLLGIHLYAEKRSLTRLIESRPLLKWIDRLTGVRAS